jgi:hypothetical protein
LPLWKWICKIAALKEKKIVWDLRLDSRETEIWCLTVDGTDFRITERKHPQMNMDKGLCSKKFNQAALKYEITMSVFEPKCVWISGPDRGGKQGMAIFREGLKDKIKPWKKCNANRGYNSSRADEKMLLQPNGCDSKEVNCFKSRCH